VVLDLITKVAGVLGEDPGDDVAAWYEKRFGEEPDYSKLLDSLAKSPAERSALLRSYFEPTGEDRSHGVKVPGVAHKALAQLAVSGHVKVFVTTNFDRLIEQALEEAGITPRVLSTPDDILGSPPLSQAGVTVLKLHGDYLDTRMKNTPAELDEYDANVDGLLDRIIDEHGFIVCGWSGIWDTALRRAFERSESRRYTTYWADVVPPAPAAMGLIEHLNGEFLQVKGADPFFTGIVDSIKSLNGSSGAVEPAVMADVPELPSGIITYLFTDVEGSTRLWQQHPNEMSKIMAHHDALLGSIVERHSGVVIKSRGEGDSIFSVFVRASDSVAAALEIQRALISEKWSGDISVRVRVSLNTGEAELRDNDYYGTAVNRCARLRAIAHGGQVVLSMSTAELVWDTLPEGVSLRDLGSHHLKDLPGMEQVFQLLHPELPSEFPPLNSPNSFRNNLPVQVTSFIGRDDEIDEVNKLLSEARLITLTGSGGSGKTRLAQEIGSQNISTYPDGVWVVGLAPLSDPKLIVEEVASTLGVGEEALFD
jgi:class 3 adenylate cyclase